MRYLLDTNAVIALVNDTTSKLARRARQERTSDNAVSAIVTQGLFYAAFKSQRAAHNVALIDALQFAVLEFDTEDSRQAGEIRAYLAVQGNPVGPDDVLIAGQALARNLTLVTNNSREFERVRGLRTENWQR